MRQLALTLGALLAGTTAASAQVARPISPYVIDLRGFYAALGQDPTTASNLGVPPAEFPKRALGGVLAVHVYPLRKANFALGIGGEAIRARGRSEAPQTSGTSATTSARPPVEQRVFGFSPALSLNFGHINGWSYLTAGMGPLSFSTFQGETAPVVAPPKKSTINVGGGARWFASPHVAFTFDVRFYLTRPEEIAGVYPGRARSRLRILSTGISIR